MDSIQWIISLLMNLAGQLPVLIVLVSGLIIILNNAAPNKLRHSAVTGLIILLLSRLLSAGLSVLPMLLLERGYIFSQITAVISGLWLALSLLQAVGWGLLVWALVKALPKTQRNRIKAMRK